MIRAPHPDHIAGGRVTQTFRMGGRQLYAGARLTREEIVRMPAVNRTALIEKGYITVWPKEALVAADAPAGERIVVPRGFGKYDVVEGRKLNAAPLSKDEALKLASLAAEPAKN